MPHDLTAAPVQLELDPTHFKAAPMPTNTAPGTAPRVTPTDIEARIASTRFFVDGTLTVCVLTMKNGFKLTGESACASVENFNQALGEKYAYQMAFNKAWAHEGYLLRDRLHQTSIAETK